VLRGYRLAEQVPLPEPAPRGLGQFQVGRRLQALRDHLESELPAELDHHVDDRAGLAGLPLRREHQPVDLQQVQRQYPELVERGRPDAEVVDRGAYPVRPELPEVDQHVLELRAAGRVLPRGHELGLGHLDHQAGRGYQVGLQRAGDGGDEVRGGQFAGTGVDRDPQVPALAPPAGQLPAGPVQYPLADLVEHAQLAGDRDQLRRGYRAERGVPPPEQRLGADRPAAGQLDDGLVDEVELAARGGGGQFLFQRGAA
jgi:hypothetical protein